MGISLQLPPNSPWRTIIRVCLLLLAEAAVIAMLRDAPLYFQIATVIAAILMLAILETEDRLGKIHPRIFLAAFIPVFMIYGALCASAVKYSLDASAKRENIHKHLSQFYVEMGSLIDESLPANISPSDFSSYQNNANSIVGNIGQWIKDNMGDAALARFWDRGGMMQGRYSLAVNDMHNTMIMNQMRLRQNLLAMLESPTWAKN
jgi:hypothetical protein